MPSAPREIQTRPVKESLGGLWKGFTKELAKLELALIGRIGIQQGKECMYVCGDGKTEGTTQTEAS